MPLDLECYQRDGFVVERNAITAGDAERLLTAAVELARANEAGALKPPTFVTPERNLAHRTAPNAEDRVSKIFRVHGIEPFAAMSTHPAIVQSLARIFDLGDIDCFLSQFIFKNAGAWGQPCHQDAYYFPFAPAQPVVGAWLATTEATVDNGCLYVVPGSHREPVHAHVTDRRADANVGYMEIVDHSQASACPVEMEPGDLLLFDSHLMHFSRDNTSNRRRAAMVYHYAAAGTVDRSLDEFGFSITDWTPVLRT